MIEWNKSNLWAYLEFGMKKSYLKLYQLLFTAKIWQFVKKFVNIVTFALYITYTYRTLADARVKKDKHLENQNVILGPCNIFVV